MSNIPKIKKVYQDKNSEAWNKLCDYIDFVEKEGIEEFEPRQKLGNELFSEIQVLPKSISKLKNIKTLHLYGSNLIQIPPEIGEMESLRTFIPYTSYKLHWYPYEIINCTTINKSTVSTRALYGNYNTKLKFPDLTLETVKYFDTEIVKCSICKKEINYSETDQYWISLVIATDLLPLLVNTCSEICKGQIITSHPHYSHLQHPPHKGGNNSTVLSLFKF